MAAAGDDSADMDSAVETALVQVADDFITSAVASASGLARRRKSTKLEAADVAMYLERTWYGVFLFTAETLQKTHYLQRMKKQCCPYS